MLLDAPSDCIEEVTKDARRTVLCDSCKVTKAIREVLG